MGTHCTLRRGPCGVLWGTLRGPPTQGALRGTLRCALRCSRVPAGCCRTESRSGPLGGAAGACRTCANARASPGADVASPGADVGSPVRRRCGQSNSGQIWQVPAQMWAVQSRRRCGQSSPAQRWRVPAQICRFRSQVPTGASECAPARARTACVSTPSTHCEYSEYAIHYPARARTATSARPLRRGAPTVARR